MRSTTKAHPRTKPPEERREELMNAAQKLFLKRGVEDTTIEQITQAAEVAKGTFYLYFSSKEDIRSALGERFGQELLRKIKTAIARKKSEDWTGKLTAWAAAGLGGYFESIRLHDILFYASRPHTREGLVNNIVIDHLVGLLEDGAEAGAWSVDDPHFMAVFLFSGLHGIVDDAHAIKEKPINRSRLTRRLEQVCLRAVGL